MNNEQVAHAWAHGSNGKGSHIYSDGIELTSYYTPIGYNIGGYFYLSAENMTSSTGRHLSYARRAVSDNYFSTHAFSYGRTPARTHIAMIQLEIDWQIEHLETVLASNKRQTTKTMAIHIYNQERTRILNHASRVGVTIFMPEVDASPESVAAYQAAKKAAEEAKEVARIKAVKKQRALDKKNYKLWLTTGAGRCPASFITRGQDQFTITGDIVRTSQGAECPIDHAIKAINFWNSRILSPFGKKFVPYHTNGHKIPLGIFTLDSIDEHGIVKAGCHTFPAKEIQRFINQWREVLGL